MANVTVSSAIDTFMQSADNAAARSNLGLATSPTFGTSIFVPLVVGGSGTTSDLTLKTTSGVGASGADMHFLVGNNGGTEALTILNSGSIGVNKTAPDVLLHVRGGSSGNTDLFKLEGTSSAVNPSLAFDNSTEVLFRIGTGGISGLSTINSKIDIAFGAGSATLGSNERMRITSAGLVGINKTAPDVLFHVRGGSSGNTDLLKLEGASSSVNPVLVFDNSTEALFRIGTGGASGLSTINSKIDIAFGTGSATLGSNERLRITSTGLVGIGTTAPDKKLEVNLGTSDAFRLTYNDSTGSATNFTDFTVSSGGDLTVTPSGGDIILAGKVTIGGGDAVAKIVSASGSINFASMAAGAEDTQTLTVTGAAASNTPSVALGWSAALPDGIVVKQAWVSAADTVSIRVRNNSAGTIDPGSLTVRATVISF